MSALERHDIQGLLLSAYGHLPCSANVLLRITDASKARRRIGLLVDKITTATGKHHGHSTNVAFTYRGLLKLGLRVAADAFPAAFCEGMASCRRARILGDTGASAPDRWLWGTQKEPVDVVLMLFSAEYVALEALLIAQRAELRSGGMDEIATLIGQRQPDGKEHFGFADGIAQPAIRGEPRRRRTTSANDVAAGEFILGYTNEYGYVSSTPKTEAASDPHEVLTPAGPGVRDLGRNGSYLVLRQLEQDVAKFWRFLDDCTRGPKGSDPSARARLAAKLVGRWPSGAPLALSPDADDPKFRNDNTFGFSTDRYGLRCPVGAHIRRANPRDGFAHDWPRQSVSRSNRHRILRRGRPYGPRLADVTGPDDKSRGLIFICLNSDIERQFEFVQQTWLNNATFSGLANEVDPLVGAHTGDAWMTIPADPVRKRIKGLERFVSTKGGIYCFLPSLRALRYLASLTTFEQ